MKNILTRSKNFILDLLFPRFCLGCGKEGDYLCQDCLGTIDINYYHSCPICNRRALDEKTCQACKNKTKLTGLFWAVLYQNSLVKKLINQLKYEGRVKDLSGVLAGFIIKSFEMMEPQPSAQVLLAGAILVPVPLYKNKLKRRGFNQAEEIAKELAKFWQIPLFSDILIKKRETAAQVDLSKKQRQENLKGAFVVSPAISSRMSEAKILLVDDVYTTGSTMSECASVLKSAGAREVWAVVVARE